MARIQGFEAPEGLAIHPSDAGTTAFREAGGVARQFANQSAAQLNQAASMRASSIKAIGSGLGDLYDAAEAHDDSLASTDASKKSADFDFDQHDKLDHLMDPSVDPNDPSGKTMVQKDPNNAKGYIGDFLNNWWQQRQELRSTITNTKAQKKFDAETDSSYRGISSKAYSIYGEVNFQAVKDNLIQTVNSRAGVAFSDPTQLDAMLEKTHTDLADYSSKVPGISAAQRSQLQTEFETNSARVVIERAVDGLSRTSAGRDQAKEIINSGKYDKYIGEDKGKLLDHIDKMDHADYADQERARRVEQQQKKDNADQRIDTYIQDAMSPQPKMKLSDIYTDPALQNNPEARDRAAKMFTEMSKFNSKEYTVDPLLSSQNVVKAMDRITKDEGDPDKITDRKAIDDLFTSHQIDQKDYSFLLEKFKGVEKGVSDKFDKTAGDFLQKYRNVIDPYIDKYGNHSAIGDMKSSQMRQDLDVERKRMLSEGKDPNNLFNQGSPDYFFSPEHLKQYYTSQEEARKFQDGLKKSFDEPMKKFFEGSPDAKPQRLFGGQPNAHYDKNLFSSGRASQLGITMQPGDSASMVNISAGGKSVQVNKYAAPYFKSFLDDLQRQGYDMKTVSGFVDRAKNEKGVVSSSPSEHAFGNAIDINGFDGNDQGLNARTNLPSNIREIAAKHGLIWGGDWVGKSRDTMHFEWSGKRGDASEEVASHDGASKVEAGLGDSAVAKIPPRPIQVAKRGDETRLPPGSRFIIPEGPFKGMVATVPEPHVPLSR